jgi:hypothetical protein
VPQAVLHRQQLADLFIAQNNHTYRFSFAADLDREKPVAIASDIERLRRCDGLFVRFDLK